MQVQGLCLHPSAEEQALHTCRPWFASNRACAPLLAACCIWLPASCLDAIPFCVNCNIHVHAAVGCVGFRNPEHSLACAALLATYWRWMPLVASEALYGDFSK